MKENLFAFILDQVESRLPEGLRPLQTEAKAALHALVAEKLAQLDYVPRAEFEAQLALLASAEEKIFQLEERIKQLEGRNDKPVALLPRPE